VKVCYTCKKEKELSDFCKNKSSKDGKSDQCRICAKEYRDANKEKRKSYPSSTKEYRQNYYNENKDTININRRNNYSKNKIRYKQARKINYQLNRTKIRKNQSEHYFRNKQYYKIKSAKYRVNNKSAINLRNRKRQLKLIGKNISQKQIDKLLEQHNYKCFYCKIELTGINLHLDHKNPLSRGGEHNIDNLVPACKTCNLRKGTKTVEEFLKYRIK
jgi:5-methylcytosine-specific restriction endonuclease McrA